MSIDVSSPGLATTLQDGGRRGLRHLGIATAGAADPLSLTIGNLLLGNPRGAPALEIALLGPRLRFRHGSRIALTGGDIDARIDGRPLPGWRPITVPADCELQLGAVRRGARSYLAVAGGIEVTPVLGSAATDLRAGFGGLDGRALRAGDRLRCARHDVTALAIARWWLDPRDDLDFDRPALLQLLPGLHGEPPAALFRRPWTIAANSDRQAVRLLEPVEVAADGAGVSAPVLPGSLQLPPDGRPILLLADAQTVGGYRHVGQLALADLPRAAQLRPGEQVHFRPGTVDEAWQRWCAQQARIERMALAVRRADAAAGP